MIVSEVELTWLTDLGIQYTIQHDALINPMSFAPRWAITFDDERDQMMFVLQWR